MMNKFVFTSGDTNGIGPEIVIKSLNQLTREKLNKFIFICPRNIFDLTIQSVKPSFKYKYEEIDDDPETVTIISLENTEQKIGFPTPASGSAAFKAIQYSFKLTSQKIADAVITAPISKTAINMSGVNFPGHTEMYAEWCGVKNFVMMFLSEKMFAALATIHEPILKVPALITENLLSDNIEVVLRTLKNDLSISIPQIAILGLNPHAGENGLIGKEEEEIIKPFLLKKEFSTFLSGPFSPDAFFANHLYKNYDAVIGMYHDQVLIPFKMLNFGAGVNYTAGLPIVRTSPDHGVAYDIAGKNLADSSSLIEAFTYAEFIVNNRKNNVKK